MTSAAISGDMSTDAVFLLSPSVIWLREEKGSIGFYQTSGTSAAARRFTLLETAILELLTNGATQSDILYRLDIAPPDLMKFLDSLNQWGEGVLRWQHREQSKALSDHNRLVEAARLRDIAMAMAAQANDNDTFHRVYLTDPQHQFDQVETTISHMFREPHAALNDRSYGQAFCDWLIANKRINPPCRIIEIGCGLGYFANALLDHLQTAYPDAYDQLSYTLFDLSPALQSAQKANCSRHADKVHFIIGNIETYDFNETRFDLALSNEVIADLSVATISLDNIQNGSPCSAAEILAQEYQLECVPVVQGNARKAVINFGAIKMLQNLEKCLNENGNAILTEYGSLDKSPKVVRFSNHEEFTVHFGQLEQVAQRLGFRTYRGTMGKVVGFDANCKTIHVGSFRTLSECLLPFLRREALPVLSYTPASLEQSLGDLMGRIGNLQFLRLDNPAAFSPFRFEWLALSKAYGHGQGV